MHPTGNPAGEGDGIFDVFSAASADKDPLDGGGLFEGDQDRWMDAFDDFITLGRYPERAAGVFAHGADDDQVKADLLRAFYNFFDRLASDGDEFGADFFV